MEQTELLNLIEKSRSGDRQAQETLIEACQDRVYYHCKKLLRNEDDALDATQDVLITVLTSLDKLREPAAFWGWVGGIAANRCRHQLSRGNRELQFAEDEDGGSMMDDLEALDEQQIPEKALDNEETRRMIMEMVDALPPDQRTCVLLYYYDEMSVKQIAEALDVAEGTVKSRLNYARKSIKTETQKLEKQGIKLYSLAPFLLFFFRKSAGLEKLSSSAAAAVRQNVLAAAGTAAVESAGATAGASGAAKAGGVGAKLAALGGRKLALGLAGLAATAGVVTGGALILSNSRSAPEPEPTAVVEVLPSETPGQVSEPQEPPKAVPYRTEVDTGNPYNVMALETPKFDEVNDAYRKINEFFEEAHQRLLEWAETLDFTRGGPGYPISSITTYEIISQDDRFVSVVLTNLLDDAGVMEHRDYCSFDAQTGVLLQLPDLLDASEEQIMSYLRSEARKTPYAAVMDEHPFKSLDDFYCEDGEIWYAWDVGAGRNEDGKLYYQYEIVPIRLDPAAVRTAELTAEPLAETTPAGGSTAAPPTGETQAAPRPSGSKEYREDYGDKGWYRLTVNRDNSITCSVCFVSDTQHSLSLGTWVADSLGMTVYSRGSVSVTSGQEYSFTFPLDPARLGWTEGQSKRCELNIGFTRPDQTDTSFSPCYARVWAEMGPDGSVQLISERSAVGFDPFW